MRVPHHVEDAYFYCEETARVLGLKYTHFVGGMRHRTGGWFDMSDPLSAKFSSRPVER